MHFSITAAFGGRLATLLKLAHQSQQLAAETGHHATSGCSSSRARLKVLPQAKQESTCINLQTAPCSVTAGTSLPSNADTRRAKLASVSKGARLARTSVTRHSSRKSSVFEPAVAWSSRSFISVVSSARAPKMATK